MGKPAQSPDHLLGLRALSSKPIQKMKPEGLKEVRNGGQAQPGEGTIKDVCVRAYACVCLRVSLYVCVRVRVCLCMCLCLCACVFVSLCV